MCCSQEGGYLWPEGPPHIAHYLHLLLLLNLENIWLDLLRRTEDEYELLKEKESGRTLPKRAETLLSAIVHVSCIGCIKS